MMRVAVAGYSNTKFSLDETPIENLLVSATKQLFHNTKNLEQKDIDAVLVSTNNVKRYLAPVLSELAGIAPKISHSVENMCNSGTNAVASGFSYIASGMADVVLITGAEQAENPGQILDWDSSRGEFQHPIFWGTIFTKSHKRKFGTTDEELAYVSALNHKNAQDNPYAHNPKQYTIQEISESKRITEDLRLLDCSRSCTGSSAILLASENVAKKYTDSPVWIDGIGQKTTSAGFTKNDLTSIESTIQAANQAYSMARIRPNNIDVVEIHDAFSVCELMILEDLGIVPKGKAAKLVPELYNTNNKKINPRGGLMGAGHPLGATGVAQIAEITSQLQGLSQKRQVENAKIGLVQNMSAAATSSTVLVLKN
ncbi:MAG: thiolase family protein [Nitrosopumilaceae archaeon]|nr:thiolase family protein [Nitrosopumilaceae archaeon]